MLLVQLVLFHLPDEGSYVTKTINSIEVIWIKVNQNASIHLQSRNFSNLISVERNILKV